MRGVARTALPGMNNPGDIASPLDVELKLAWRRSDPAIERDAELYWQREGMLRPGADVALRLAQLCSVAYVGDGLAGLTTVNIREIDFLHCKLAMFRCAVSRSFRMQHIASRLTVFTRDILEAWSRDHPEEEVLGLGCVVQSRTLVEHRSQAMWPDGLAFVGYTAQGHQMRVYWFRHAKLSTWWPGDDLVPDDGLTRE